MGCFVCVLAFTFLTIAIVYRRRCFNFPTLLACNTILATFLYSCDNVAVAVYMLIWDQQSLSEIDSLCSLRAYIHHSTIAGIHHSFILQAMEKYFKIKRINFLHNRKRQVLVVLIQWIFDFTFSIPIFLTGNMPKLSSDNLCFISLTRLYLLLYMVTISFLVSDITLAILYRRLLNHVREISSRVHAHQQNQMRRDLIVVRRIILLNSQLALVGVAVLTVVILSVIRVDILPSKWMRPLLLAVNVVLCPMITILFWFTPNLRESLVALLNKRFCQTAVNHNRVVPATEGARF